MSESTKGEPGKEPEDLARADVASERKGRESDRPESARLPRARSIERRERRRERAQTAPKRMARTFVAVPKNMSPATWLVALMLAIFLALSIANPLRNYFEQRAELAQINAKIEGQEKEKAELTNELNRYRDQDYIKEQARTRLGLIEPGESAYRIISPKIHADKLGTEQGEDATGDESNRDWYARLWDSISTPEEAKDEDSDPAKENHKLPTVPEQNPEQGSAQNPEQAPEQNPGAPEGAPQPAPEQAPAN
ncbi:FtsB family cell division protein [Corynebacterium macclintockiae]|uniref:FtsB family cell division protein n=1 Tax=Corynebacterium macclintockiae TaxID=2913501 RepID=UPI003EBE0945